MAVAESVATVFSEKHGELKMSPETEALLRASIAGATSGVNIYLAALAYGKNSPLARKYLAEARRHCRRTVEHLRRRVRHSIAYLSRVISERQLTRSVEYVPL